MLEHECKGGILPWIYYLFGACKPMEKYDFDYDENGNPLIKDCLTHPFPEYYATPEVTSGFNNLYTNKYNL